MRKNILVGFFVVVGLIIFIVGIFVIGSKSGLFEKSFEISAKFKNTAGLKEGSNVEYNGVKVGVVKKVTLINDTLVKVDMTIEENKHKFILTDAIASIASDGLMGDKIITLSPGHNGGVAVSANDLVQTNDPINTDKVIRTLSESNDNIRVITENLKLITTDLNTKNGPAQMLYKDTALAQSLKQSFNNLDVITGKVLKVSSTLQDVSAKIENGNGALSEIINDTSLAHNLAHTMDKLKETSDQLIRASSELTETVQHANSGKGAVNMFLTDTNFSANAQQSMLNIKKASVGLDQNMEALKHSFLTRGYFRKQAKKQKQQSDTASHN